jgi:hypothetical protein
VVPLPIVSIFFIWLNDGVFYVEKRVVFRILLSCSCTTIIVCNNLDTFPVVSDALGLAVPII